LALSLLVLKTRQIDLLRDFYTTLGIDFTEEQHGKGPVHYAGKVGEVVIEIYPLPAEETWPDKTTRLGFTVANLGLTLEALEAIGTRVVTKPHRTEWGLRAVVRDPDGRAVDLIQL
jgi:hypothetical protein